ncbi:TIR domain-containing protein [Lysobacter brunescens]|uniref:TIR domain-containing protein n=1 Tax=Lysobacter brunescens TaxID=262323 RepID=A0ABW2YDG7_9GAMM
MTDQSPLRVFISYSHDSDAHRERVLGLSERLRGDGIETILDRYVERGSPPEGWPRWMLNGLEKATHVLCICTETYYRRFRGHEAPGKGKGVDWEGALMTQALYDARSVSTKFIPVLFAGTDAPSVPEPLRGQTFYVVDSDAGYEALYDALLNQSGVVPGPVGTPKRKPRATGQQLSFTSAAEAKDSTSDVTRKIARTQLDKHAPRVLFGRETELAALDAAWANGTLNIYTLVAWGGAGKTSLVFRWVQTRFAATGWPGVERYFDWSFYSQGTDESRQTSADLFIAKALEFFGDPDPTVGSPHERGERLAGLIRRHRTLLILDGIEPLQYPPNDPQAGRLKDQALDALLRELAADNPGLVVITTREHLTDIDKLANTEEQKLDKLNKEAAVALLRDLQIVGTDEELHAAWQGAGGHALTLSLLGRFIADAFDDHDIRHYREVKFKAADQEHQGRSAFKVMVAYERWLRSAGPERQRELAVLRLTGLFDRPMAKGCLQALRAEPSIPGLTDALVTLTEQQWNIAVTRLSKVELLSVSPDAIDAHPLIREYFAAQLKRDQPEAFQAAHSRLFDDLCANTPHHPDGIDGLAPLYEAVTHGCLAGRHQEAREKVYRDRILRGAVNDGFYSTKKLGAIGANLAAIAAFFDEPWSRVSPNLTEADQAWLLNEAAFHLRALGRLTEALQPIRATLELNGASGRWKNAAVVASSLSELEVTLGRLPDAVTDARQSITHADQSGDAFQRMSTRTAAADALYQSGQRAEAGTLFAEAERMQQERQPQFDLLYSVQGFQYCDWLLAPAKQAAWQKLLNQTFSSSKSQISDCLAEVERRAKTTLSWSTPRNLLLDIALDHLTLARVGLIRAILANPLPQPTLDLTHVAAAVNGLRAAVSMDQLPRSLLTAALYHFVRGEHNLALKHLAEAQQIAERGPMPLFLADIHLTRARLFHDHDELAKAAKLIRTLGYGRRYEELADAERADKIVQTEGKRSTSGAGETQHVIGGLAKNASESDLPKTVSDSTLTHPQTENKPTMSFHVFLSHNSKDKPAVRDLKQQLIGYSLTVWLDEDELQPGIPWQQLLEDGIHQSRSIAVLIGKDGLGPWEDEEMQAALRLAVADKRPVIPVLMPGAAAQPKLPMFLGNRTWVDLRNGFTKDGLNKLVWGITGNKPPPLAAPRTIAAIEFTLDRPLSESDEAAFRSAFQQATGIDASLVRIASIRSGSTIVRMEASPDVIEDAVRQFQSAQEKLHKFSQLTGLKVMRWAIGGTEYELKVEASEAGMQIPRLLARFQEEDGQPLEVDDGGDDGCPAYWIDLWIDGAPPETTKVAFEVLDDPERDEPSWTVKRKKSAARDFLTDDFTSYGDVKIIAVGTASDHRLLWEIKSSLLDALMRGYRTNIPNNAAYRRAIDQLRTESSLPSSPVISSSITTPRSNNKGNTMTRCKVLFLASAPLDCDPLELDEEARAIGLRILQTDHRDAIDFVSKFAVRRDDLQLYLNKEGPHVLHFSGHGTKDEIEFKGDDGNAVPVSKAALKAMLKAVKDNIRLVILNACYTGETADSITDVIDCAIGMKRGISDEAARVFAASFYLAVGFGRSVNNAFDQAVASIQVMGIPEDKTPVLTCRDGVDPNDMFLVQATVKQSNPQ